MTYTVEDTQRRIREIELEVWLETRHDPDWVYSPPKTNKPDYQKQLKESKRDRQFAQLARDYQYTASAEDYRTLTYPLTELTLDEFIELKHNPKWKMKPYIPTRKYTPRPPKLTDKQRAMISAEIVRYVHDYNKRKNNVNTD